MISQTDGEFAVGAGIEAVYLPWVTGARQALADLAWEDEETGNRGILRENITADLGIEAYWNRTIYPDNESIKIALENAFSRKSPFPRTPSLPPLWKAEPEKGLKNVGDWVRALIYYYLPHGCDEEIEHPLPTAVSFGSTEIPAFYHDHLRRLESSATKFWYTCVVVLPWLVVLAGLWYGCRGR